MRYAFGRCQLDTESRDVALDGASMHLSPKAFELLRLLIEGRPRVVPKAELMQRLWPDSFVEEANLPVLIAEVRAAIGDAGGMPCVSLLRCHRKADRATIAVRCRLTVDWRSHQKHRAIVHIDQPAFGID